MYPALLNNAGLTSVSHGQEYDRHNRPPEREPTPRRQFAAAAGAIFDHELLAHALGANFCSQQARDHVVRTAGGIGDIEMDRTIRIGLGDGWAVRTGRPFRVVASKGKGGQTDGCVHERFRWGQATLGQPLHPVCARLDSMIACLVGDAKWRCSAWSMRYERPE